MTNMNRRNFLKIAGGLSVAALAGQTALLVSESDAGAAGKSVSRTTGRVRRAVSSTCRQCPARCGILGFLEDDILVKIEGNPLDPNTRGKICAKGLSGLNLLYHPERLLFPIKRAGERGEGKWRRITWDEALKEIAGKLAVLKKKGSEAEFLFISGLLEGNRGLTRLFLNAYDTPSVASEADLYQANKVLAQRTTWGADEEVSDLSRASLILNFGSNPYEFHSMYLPVMRRLMAAQRRGAKLITLDPRLSNTAARSHQWLPISPGTDGLLALALSGVILEKGLADGGFLEKWTNYPLESLKAHLAQFSVARASKESGLPASVIEDLAMELAASDRVTIISGDGVSQHANGTQNERAVALLNAVIGNIDVPGGYCLPRTYDLSENEPKPQRAGMEQEGANFLNWFGGDKRIGVLMTSLANPAYSSPSPQVVARALKDERVVPFYVAVDTFLTESSMMADLVLPAATYLESYDLASPPAYDLVPFITLTQPVVSPRGESRSCEDLCLDLARLMGGDMEKKLSFSSAESYYRKKTSVFGQLSKDGGWDHLREKGIWFDRSASPSFRTYEKEGFNTPSRKFEVYSSVLENRGLSPVPTYEELPPVPGKNLRLVTFQFSVHTYSRTATNMWLSEIVHENPVWINKETARLAGIKSGDEIQISSAAGSIKVKARVTAAIRPDVIAMGSCVGHWASGKVAQAKRFESVDPNTDLLWWQEHGNGVHPYFVIPVVRDPAAGGPSWKDTVVSISKV